MEKPPSRPKDRSHLRAVPNPPRADEERDPDPVERLLERAVPKAPIAVTDAAPPSSIGGVRRRDKMDPWDDVEGATPARGPARPIKDTKAILEEEIAARESGRAPRAPNVASVAEEEEDSADEAKTEPVSQRSRRAPASAPAPARRLEIPRWVPLGALTFAAVLGVFLARQAINQRGVDAKLMPIAGPYLAAGFVMLPASTFDDESLAVAVDRPSCLIALAAAGGADVAVGRPSGTVSGKGSVAWCTCGAEEDRVTVSGSSGVRVLRAESRDIGGDYGLLLLEPRPRMLAPARECAGADLDAWLRDGKSRPRVDDGLVDAATRHKLAESGFTVVASAPSAHAFALVPGAKDSCFLAWSADPRDTLTLRLMSGEAPLQKVAAAVGACSEQGATSMVWRDGQGVVMVERVAAGRVGGTHGLRETASRIAPGPMATWVSPKELAWDAAATLRADMISPPEIEISSDGHAVGQARFVAVSTGGASVRPETDSSTAYACEPTLGPRVSDALCVQGVGLAWRLGESETRAGIAEAALPFWMQTFESTVDPSVLALELDLAKLGRRLVAEGFEPTILEGTTELSGGIGILGRPGDDAIVAVDLVRDPARAVPCTDGPSWELLGEPRRVPIRAGAKMTLECPRGAGAPRAEGHAVVFRHVVAK
jgi:hypothetical protein